MREGCWVWDEGYREGDADAGCGMRDAGTGCGEGCGEGDADAECGMRDAGCREGDADAGAG